MITSDFLDQLRINHTQSNQEAEDDSPVEISHYSESDALADSGVSTESKRLPGTLSPEARRALVSLLRQGVILFSQKAKLFESLCRYQDAVRRHLSEMYLKLVLDEKAGIAFVASAQGENEADIEDSDAEEMVSLISRRTLSLYDTLLLLVLRKHYQDRETSGELRIVVDVERIESYLTPFLPLTNSSKSDREKLNTALRKMVDKKILSMVRGNEDRFEITPIIRYVVGAEFLETMLKEYIKIAAESGVELSTDEHNQIDTQEA